MNGETYVNTGLVMIEDEQITEEKGDHKNSSPLEK